MSAPAAFHLLGPLPTGTTLLEASAGTGKTYTIAALATRYIAQGTATIDQMLMITFGRSATRELRERVREALTNARDALRDNAGVNDPVIAMLAALPPDEKASAAERLARAVADFDAGTIATTHQFCSHALSGLGIRADVDPGEVFVENISDLVDQVVDDFYVRKYGTGTVTGAPISSGGTGSCGTRNHPGSSPRLRRWADRPRSPAGSSRGRRACPLAARSWEHKRRPRTRRESS